MGTKFRQSEGGSFAGSVPNRVSFTFGWIPTVWFCGSPINWRPPWWLLPVVCLQCFSAMMALLWLVAGMSMDSVTSHHWMTEGRIPRFLPVFVIQCFFEMMATLWLAARISMDSVTFHLWMKECAMLLYQGFYWWWVYSASPQWWHCCGLWPEWVWTVWHPTIGWRKVVYPGFCRFLLYSASSKWWQRCGLRPESVWTVWHSTFGWRNVLCCYTQVSTGGGYTVLLRNDGAVVACGKNGYGQCNIPPLDEGRSYNQVSAGGYHTVLLRNDGTVVACGWNEYGQCDIPPLDDGRSYTQVSAGAYHTVLLRNDGTVVVCGRNEYGQCDIPPLDDGMSYTQVSTGGGYTVLLRNDGAVVACGENGYGQCNIPPLDEGRLYTQVSARNFHTVLLRNDGSVVACGLNDLGQCNIPSLKSWFSFLGFAKRSLRYIPNLPPPLGKNLVVQLVFTRDTGVLALTCYTLAGQEVLLLKPHGLELASNLHEQIAGHLKGNRQSLRLVLLDGQLLTEVCRVNPAITVADLSQKQWDWQAMLLWSSSNDFRYNVGSDTVAGRPWTSIIKIFI